MENMTIDQGQAFYNPNALTVYKYIAPTGEVTYTYIKTVEARRVATRRVRARVH